MGNTIAEFVEKLKERLKNNQWNYNEHHSWRGNTEGGFYDTDEFDFDALMKEIDTFSEEFKSNKETPNAGSNGPSGRRPRRSALSVVFCGVPPAPTFEETRCLN